MWMTSEGVRFRAPPWPVLAVVLALAVGLLVLIGISGEGPAEGPDPVAAAGDGSGSGGESRAPPGEDPCVTCHDESDVMPAVIADWEASKHYEEDVSCVDCHLSEAGAPGAFSHNGRYITAVVSPLVCAKCHEDEVAQFGRSLHAPGAAYYELLYNKGEGDLPYRESQLEGGFLVSGGKTIDHAATIRGCQACHGTNMTNLDHTNETVWPNNGIGRINPDGSRGSCSACHSRHKFSIAEARHPETCGQCHLGPDHPHIEIYQESKHGNIYAAEGESWNWDREEWEAGRDYRAPTCAACHMSAAGDMPATHDVGERLSWELESPVSTRTNNKANSLGWNIGSGLTWQQKRANMQTVCMQCHSETWTANYYVQADYAVELYNAKYTAAKAEMDALYREGLLTNTTFDEPIEFVIYEMWHHEGRRARVGAFMMGPDYVQWHGFYEVFEDEMEINTTARELREKAAAPPDDVDDGEDDDEEDEATEALWAAAVALGVIAVLMSLVAIRRGRAAPPAT